MALVVTLVTYSLVALLSYYALVLSYRVLLHPLRKYPGPFLASLSEAYGGVYAIKKYGHLNTYYNHLRYGPVIREAPNRLVFNSATALQAIYQNDAVTKSYVYAIAQPDKRNVFTVADKSEHRPKRKLMSHLLSDQSMRSFESTMSAQINVFLEQILHSGSRPYNVTPACRNLGLNVAGHLGFGYDLNLQTDEKHRYLADAITFGNYRVNSCMQFTPLAMLNPGPIMDLFPNSLRRKLMDTLTKMIEHRLADSSDFHHDLLSVYAQQTDIVVKSIKQQSLWGEAVFFFAAAATFFYLSRNLECYKKLAEEIRTTFKSPHEIRGGPQLSGCRYLRACIDESLRMSPPVPGTLWREAVSMNHPMIVDGHVIPPGTQVGVSIYSLHHNEEYFPDSFRFEPERWLPGGSPRRSNPAAFTPFSIGSRGCAGKSMAYLETSLVLAKTLWYFDFKRASSEAEKSTGAGISGFTHRGGEESEFPVYDLFAAGHNGPILEFKPRRGLCDELARSVT
ncbi:hypothetical protein KJ359_002380 [Pestalotiopsis sp. 9143b]|nr:hypothetical protein KJ359_002380 [Pestalotiopsis sp. 9143b]